jgi:radical SAM protein with 4Fe4S-binding SPASM domain
MPVTQPYDFIIQWHLTEKCNLRCRHCYQEGKKVRELPGSIIQATITEIAEMLQAWQDAYEIHLSPSFNITGGEPFLRPDFFTILEKMTAAGFACYVLTNGTLITPERAKKLAALGVAGVQVSLEGMAEVHESIRGHGSFAAALQGIWNLLDAGVKVSLNCTVSKFNADYIEDLVALAASLGVSQMGFSRLVPSGRGAGLWDQMLPPPRLKKLYEKVFSLEVEGLEIVTGDPVASQMAAPIPEGQADASPAGGCAAGVAGLTIQADGTILPCRRLPVPLGRVGQDSLREVWAASPVLERLRDKSQYGGKCGACPRWADCRGCRALAYAYSQAQGNPDYLAPDPQCFID